MRLDGRPAHPLEGVEHHRPVADRLGVSRQRIHELCMKGQVETLRVVNDDGSLAWLNIYEDSVKAYLRDAKRQAAKRVGRLERVLQTL